MVMDGTMLIELWVMLYLHPCTENLILKHDQMVIVHKNMEFQQKEHMRNFSVELSRHCNFLKNSFVTAFFLLFAALLLIQNIYIYICNSGHFFGLKDV